MHFVLHQLAVGGETLGEGSGGWGRPGGVTRYWVLNDPVNKIK